MNGAIIVDFMMYGTWKMDVRGYNEFHYVDWCRHPVDRRTVYDGLLTCRDCGRPFDAAGEPFVNPQKYPVLRYGVLSD